jgi:hypothetical protein
MRKKLKTQKLSVTENLIYCTGQKTHYNDHKVITLHSTNPRTSDSKK